MNIRGVIHTQFYKHYHAFLYKNIFKADGHKLVFRVLSIRRSGQHAIMNWIQNQYKGNLAFYNNVQQGKNVFESSDNRETRYRPWINNNALLYNIENPALDNSLNESGIGSYDFMRNIIIMRDPFNCFASYYSATWPWGNPFKTNMQSRLYFVGLWKSLAREYLGYNFKLENKLLINYNQWVLDIQYRESIAAEFGSHFTDDGFNATPTYGSGSSFHGKDNSYLKRWDSLKYNADFLSLFEDRDLWELSNRIFGHIEGTEMLTSESLPRD